MTVTYRVTFADDGRIGRSRGNGPFDLTARDADHLAHRDLEVSLDCGNDDQPHVGHIFAGVQVAARFTVEPAAS